MESFLAQTQKKLLENYVYDVAPYLQYSDLVDVVSATRPDISRKGDQAFRSEIFIRAHLKTNDS